MILPALTAHKLITLGLQRDRKITIDNHNS
jgi:hypothetical protein